MRTILKSGLLSFLVLFVCFFSFGESIAGGITGTINVGGVPINTGLYSLQVYAWQNSGSVNASTNQVNSAGLYTLSNLSAGSYTVKAVIFGVGFSYVEEFWYNQTYAGNATPVPVGANQVVSGIDFSFVGSPNVPTFGTISGTVSSFTSATLPVPVANVTVTAQNGGTTYNATTDTNGNYTINVAQNGSYVISALLNSTGFQMVQYWDHVNNVASATALNIVTGTATNNINFDFNLSGGSNTNGTITGFVSMLNSPINTALYNVQVTAIKQNGWGIYTTNQIVNGTYTIANVPVGSYIVKSVISGIGFSYIEEFWYNQTYAANATPVFINGGQITSGINFSFVGSSNPPQVDAWITGTVTKVGFGAIIPVANAIVKAENDSATYTATTNSLGNYTINLLQAGTYKVSAQTPSASTNIPQKQFWDHVYLASLATPVTVASGQTANNINFDFNNPNSATGSISGTVNVNGLPVDTTYYDVQVYAIPVANAAGLVLNIQQNGNYTFTNLPAGNYVVKAVISGKGFPVVAELWYDNTYAANATQIFVNGGISVTGINFNFAGGNIPTGFGTIGGNVSSVDSLGNTLGAVSGAEVYLLPASGFLVDTLKVVTDANGNYTMSGVPTGTNVKSGCFANGFYSEYYNNQSDFFSADTIFIGTAGGTLNGINFSLEAVNTTFANNSVSGTITNTSGNPVENALIVIISANDLDAPLTMSTQITDVNGNYQISNLAPDDYYVFSLAHGFVPTFLSDVQNWQNSATVNVNGNPVNNTNINLPQVANTSFCSISGTVLLNNGTSLSNLENAVVYAVDGNGTVLGYDLSKANGVYQISGLAPGNYYVYVSKLGLPTETVSGIQVSENSPATNVNFVVNSVTEVTEETNPEVSKNFVLANNFPNPFNPTTKIEFAIPEFSNVKISVYNVLGQLVKTLINQNLEKGSYKTSWNGTNESGKSVSSGIYFYRLEAGNFNQTKKMLFLK
ncbi:carboxypeptidase regulatory-like domain-containing protein [bacterium]|nr:carboxypeptidase regulatory-like domain-containing protein [bacterium]